MYPFAWRFLRVFKINGTGGYAMKHLWKLALCLMLFAGLMVISRAVPTQAETVSEYTVEFGYKGLEYVLPGDSSVAMSEILATLGLSGEVTAVEISDTSLFSARNETGEWIVTAHRAFSSTEWMKVTIGGVVYEITVTDGLIVSYLDADGNTQTHECTVLRTKCAQLPEGWFVTETVMATERVTVTGDVHLILQDKYSFEVNGGINVSEGSSLTIYA